MLRTVLKSAITICGISLILAVVPGCKKNSPAPSLAGTWKNIDTVSSPGFKYLVLRNDQTAYKLGTLIYNLHTKEGVAYVVEKNEITLPLSGMGATVYSYQVSGDTLYMTSPGSTWRFKKDADQDPAVWVRDISISSFSSAGNGFWLGPLDYNGSSYVISSVYTKKLYSVNATNTLQVDSTTAMGGIATGLASSASGTWISTPSVDLKLRNIDLPTSTVSALSSAAPAAVISMAKHGSKILVLTATGTFYDYDPVSDNFIPLASLPQFFSGSIPTGYIDLEVKDDKVYFLYFTYLMELDLAAGQFTKTYNLQSGATGLSLNGSYFGLCYDGTSFVSERVTQGTSAYDIHIDIAKFNLP